MLRPNSYIDKEKIIKLIKEKIDEGYDIIEHTTLESKEIGRMFMDMFELDKTLEQIEQEHAYDEENKERDKSKVEIEKALSKNKEVEVVR